MQKVSPSCTIEHPVLIYGFLLPSARSLSPRLSGWLSPRCSLLPGDVSCGAEAALLLPCLFYPCFLLGISKVLSRVHKIERWRCQRSPASCVSLLDLDFPFCSNESKSGFLSVGFLCVSFFFFFWHTGQLFSFHFCFPVLLYLQVFPFLPLSCVAFNPVFMWEHGRCRVLQTKGDKGTQSVLFGVTPPGLCARRFHPSSLSVWRLWSS